MAFPWLPGASLLTGTGCLATGGSGNVYVGTSSPAAIVVQDATALSVGGNLDLNYQNTVGNASTLTLTGGSLVVSGKTYIGEATMRTGPGTTRAAFYQSGGMANFKGATTVGDNGTATSLLDISGGSLAVTAGLVVGNQGNGVVNIQGSGILSVTGGLSIGDDSTLATCGSVNLSSRDAGRKRQFDVGQRRRDRLVHSQRRRTERLGRHVGPAARRNWSWTVRLRTWARRLEVDPCGRGNAGRRPADRELGHKRIAQLHQCPNAHQRHPWGLVGAGRFGDQFQRRLSDDNRQRHEISGEGQLRLVCEFHWHDRGPGKFLKHAWPTALRPMP